MSDRIFVDGKRYDAGLVGLNLWMVKRFFKDGDDNDYVEALIQVETTDPVVAIQAAIDRGSWG
jgi:hypothetical protein